MHFIVDKEKKIIIGISAKAGSTHILSVYQYLKNKNYNHLKINQKKIKLIKRISDKLPDNINLYEGIFIVRNPYDRLISGYRDKLKKGKSIRNKFEKKNIELNFKNFVKTLEDNIFKKDDDFTHHFYPQLCKNNLKKILKCKNIIMYDLNNINYKYLQNKYNIKEIPKIIMNFKGGHTRNRIDSEELNRFVYDDHFDKYSSNKIKNKYFFNEELKNRVYNFFKIDFEFFKKYNLNYESVE